MTLLAISERSARAPSEVFGITCRYCAWCFDQALFTRLAIRADKDHQQREAEAEIRKRQQDMQPRRMSA